MRRLLYLLAVASVVTAIGGLGSYWVYKTQKNELLEEASGQIGDVASAFVHAVTKVFEPVLAVSELIKSSGIQDVGVEGREPMFFALSTGIVRRYGQINGMFIGFPDGRFLHTQDLLTNAVHGTNAGLLTGRIIDQPKLNPAGRWKYHDPVANRWKVSEGADVPYDPRQRPWYRAAMKERGAIWTDAYVFASSGKLGVTYAEPLFTRSGTLWGVLGVDMSLGTLSETLFATANAVSDSSKHIFATDLGKRVIGHPGFVEHTAMHDSGLQTFLERYRKADSFESTISRRFSSGETVKFVSVGDTDYLAAVTNIDPQKGMPLQLYLARDVPSVLARATETVQRNVLFVFISIVVFGVVTIYALKLRVEVTARQRAEGALIDARDAAESATKAKSTFLAMMSHEIRTPMNGVVSMSELLMHSRLKGEQRQMAKIITDSANALLTIINDILDFSKIEAGKLDIEQVAFSLTDVVAGSAALLAPRAEEKNLDLIVDIDVALADRRLGDPTRLRQILLNLGGNAVKFTETGAVELTVEAKEAMEGETGDWLRFEIRDTGIGLTPEQRDKLFQAFVQADTSTSRKYGGTGLGLSICQRLTELMGGRIGADSVIGEGSVFWFELPLEPEAATEGDERRAPLSDAASDKASVAAASVQTIGLSARAREVAERYLRSASISTVAHFDDMASVASGSVDLRLIGAKVLDKEMAAFDGMDGTAGKIAIVGWKGQIPALSGQLEAARPIMITPPMTHSALMRAVAIALGLEAPDEADAEIREDLAFAPPEIEEARGANALILVAEDNQTNQMVIRQMLSKMGFACEVAGNGKIALSMLERPGYGLVLTDFNMPEMDGFELTEAVRANERAAGNEAAHLPVIALTADTMEGTEEACLDAGMDQYLSKPIDSQKLGRMLAEYLPNALPLRRVPDDPQTPEATDTTMPDWDPDIFDHKTLAGPAGVLDQEAKELIEEASEDWVGKVVEINAALAQEDTKRARDVVHALKGASLSVGAVRLGQIASDIQDYLDADDLDMAVIMSEVLEPTVQEFREILPKILKL